MKKRDRAHEKKNKKIEGVTLTPLMETTRNVFAGLQL